MTAGFPALAIVGTRPLAYTYPYFILFLVTFVWSFVRESRIVRNARKETSRGQAPDDRGSLQVVMMTQGVAFLVVFWLAWMPYGRIPHPLLAFWIGWVVWVSGALLRRYCFRTLGLFFTGEVRVRPDQRVITSGPYRWIRHPAYTAGMLLAVGLSILLDTWLGAVIALALSAAGYAYRVHVEERALTASLGPEYSEYAARTKRFIPFVV